MPKCLACDVAWEEGDRCWFCGGPGIISWVGVNSGPNYAHQWGVDPDPEEMLTWVGLV